MLLKSGRIVSAEKVAVICASLQPRFCKSRLIVCLNLFLLLISVTCASAGMLLQYQLSYDAANGDTLISIGSRTGADWKKIAADNGIDPSGPLKAGRKLRIAASEIIPEKLDSGIIIDIPGRMLYLFESRVPIMTFPVGLGMPGKEGQKGWETPEGKFTVKGRLKSPDWAVPKSIKEEMQREGRAVKESYPPGPKNPVGGYVLQTTLPGILIHETIDPSSVYRFMSHGCVRLKRDDMEQLFDNVKKGLSGMILYRPVKVAQLSDGRVFMEVNKDVYAKIPDMKAEARRVLKKAGLFRKVDLKAVDKAVEAATGIPVEVTVN